MKKLRIVPAVGMRFLPILLVGVMAVLASCGSSRDYHRTPPPPPRVHTNFSLILSPHPGLVISMHPSGRYYYRDPRGRIYWRGNDNRFYLDRRYIKRSYHRHRQYGDWRRYYRR